MQNDRLKQQFSFNTRLRIPCPSCRARRGLAPLLGFLDTAGVFGFCHACGYKNLPNSSVTKGKWAPKTSHQPGEIQYVGQHIIDHVRRCAALSRLHLFAKSLAGENFVSHLNQWNVGGDCEGRTVFMVSDVSGKICTAKTIDYDGEGLRRRDVEFGAFYGATDVATGRIVALSKSKGYTNPLYGSQWLKADVSMIDYRRGDISSYSTDTLCIIVESEKTAVFGSYLFPDVIWLAIGGTQGLNRENAKYLKGRKVLVLLDADNAGSSCRPKIVKTLHDHGAIPVTSVSGMPPETAFFGGVCKSGYDMADFVVEVLKGRSK
jgi:hypothetical protein